MVYALVCLIFHTEFRNIKFQSITQILFVFIEYIICIKFQPSTHTAI